MMTRKSALRTLASCPHAASARWPQLLQSELEDLLLGDDPEPVMIPDDLKFALGDSRLLRHKDSNVKCACADATPTVAPVLSSVVVLRPRFRVTSTNLK